MKKVKPAVVLSLVIVLLASMFLALSACKSNDDDNKITAAKPDFSLALGNYEQLTKKSSVFEADLTLSLHRKNQDKVIAASVTQKATLSRIFVDGAVYAEGSLKTSVVDEQMLNLYVTAMGIIQKDYKKEKDSAYVYLSGQSSFNATLGHKDDFYNLKTAYDDGTPRKVFWGATNDATPTHLLNKYALDFPDFKISDYLMISSFLDFTQVQKWMSADEASKFFSSISNSFIYNMTGNAEKIHDLIFSFFDDMTDRFDDEKYAEQLALAKKVLPYLKKWVSIGPSTVDAFVNADKLPLSMKTTLCVNLNINVTELNDILSLILKTEDREQIMTTLSLMMFALGLCGSEGQGNTLGLTFDLTLNETFAYDKNSCSFDNADMDMFLPLNQPNDNRQLFLYPKETEK